MKTAKELFHKWLKQWGGNFLEHEEEIIRDIRQYTYSTTTELLTVLLKNIAFSRNEALEEAADICDQESTVEGIAQKCANKIRELKDKL